MKVSKFVPLFIDGEYLQGPFKVDEFLKTTRFCTVLMHSNSFVCVFQLPHLPHISEGLVKWNLKHGDMRDMSLGQLQVITNDLHSQIQSE